MGELLAQDQTVSVIQDESGYLILGNQSELVSAMNQQRLISREVKMGALTVGPTMAQVIGELGANSGRWVKLTKESSELLSKYAKAGSIQKGVAQAADGKVVKWLEFATPNQLLSPAAATGVAGIMAQAALEQAIQEITDYLEAIDKKVDDLLQDQKDSTVADLIGVVLEVDEAEEIRKKTGILDETAWHKLAPCAKTTSRSLGYALTKLKCIADKLSTTKNAEELAGLFRSAVTDVNAWLTIAARSIQVRDRLSVLELERAYCELPEVLEKHRLGIVEARKTRLAKVRGCIVAFQGAIEKASERLREEKLLHPFIVDPALQCASQVSGELSEFARYLNLEIEEHEIERARDWNELAGEALASAADSVARGASSLGAAASAGARQLGDGVVEGAGMLGDVASKGIAEVMSGAAVGAQQFGKALESVDLGKLMDAVPWKKKK